MEKTSLSKIIKFLSEDDTPLAGASKGVVPLFQRSANNDSFNPLETLLSDRGGRNDSGMDQPHETELEAKQRKATAEIEAARLEAEKLLKEAGQELAKARQNTQKKQAEADSILEKARKKAIEIEQDAYNSGFAQGKKDGEDLGLREYQAKGKRLEQLISEISTLGDSILKRYETELVLLCTELSRAILMHEARTSSETIKMVLKEAAKEAVEGSRLEIHINPMDSTLLPETIQDELKRPGAMPVVFVEDQAVDEGGCLIETDFGVIDATVQRRWQAVREKIEKMFNENF